MIFGTTTQFLLRFSMPYPKGDELNLERDAVDVCGRILESLSDSK